jgi:hypothetical protein
MGDTASFTLTKRRLNKRRLKDLLVGLMSLDGVRTGKDELVAFEFSRGTHSTLAEVYVAVERALMAFNVFDRACQKRHGVYDGMPTTSENAAKLAAYTDEIEAEKDAEVKLPDFPRIKLSELLTRPAAPGDRPGRAPANNPIPQSVLNRLWPIIDDDRPA